MKNVSEGVSAIERVSRALDLPGEAAGLPRVEIIGLGSVCVENHRGILEYSDSVIEVGTQRGRVRIQGEGLKIRSMNSETLLAEGRVLSVELGV